LVEFCCAGGIPNPRVQPGQEFIPDPDKFGHSSLETEDAAGKTHGPGNSSDSIHQHFEV